MTTDILDRPLPVAVEVHSKTGCPYCDEVKKFLAERGVEFPAYLKAEKDQEFIDGMGKQWTGALPATFLFDGTGKLRDFWEGEATFNVFEQKVVEILGKQTKPAGGTP